MNRILALVIFSLISACSTPKESEKASTKHPPKTHRERKEDKIGGYLFDGPLYSTTKPKNETSGIGVNSYLWKASLEATAFLPKNSIDPFGGAILSDWYSPPQTPQERLKVEVIIIGRELKSDALKVSIFRQKKDKKGQWIDERVDPKTVDQFEETILTRARELKIAEEK